MPTFSIPPGRIVATLAQMWNCSLMEEALATAGPVLVEAVIDPFEPPMPPKTTIKQATRLAEALMKGEPNRETILTTLIRDKVREMI